METNPTKKAVTVIIDSGVWRESKVAATVADQSMPEFVEAALRKAISVQYQGTKRNTVITRDRARCVCRFDAMGHCPVHGLITD